MELFVLGSLPLLPARALRAGCRGATTAFLLRQGVAKLPPPRLTLFPRQSSCKAAPARPTSRMEELLQLQGNVGEASFPTAGFLLECMSSRHPTSRSRTRAPLPA
ncbi:unnamed protein product [Urochloa humidicola]